MKGKITAVLFILVFLLVVAVVFTFLTSLDRRSGNPAANTSNDVVVTENTPTPVPVQENAPAGQPAAPAAQVPAPAVQETEEPVSAVIEMPEPSAVPMEAPSEPSSVGKLLSSGSFSSRTGHNINIRADWEAHVAGANEVSIDVTVYVLSYSLHMAAFPDRVNIGLNGQFVSLDAPAVDYDSNTALLTTKLNSCSFTTQLNEGESRSLDLQVEWQYNGSYSGVFIPSIECGGTITVER